MMEISLLQAILSVLSGAAVGFTLGLLGGGGSILAVPLLLYVVGLPNAHVAIGTGALAVAANAFVNLAQHARNDTVKWPCAIVFAVAGIFGAWLGSTMGKAIEGDRLLFLFALIMIVVGVAMLMRRNGEGDPSVRITPAIGVRLAGIGFLTGLLSGFFGIGGGFLIVPGIMLGRVLLQRLGLAADNPQDDQIAPYQAAALNSSAMKSPCALMSFPPMFRTCPFLNIAIAS